MAKLFCFDWLYSLPLQHYKRVFVATRMKVYFYHTQDIQYILGRIVEGEFPSHFLYGATRLPDNDIEVVYHQSRIGQSRWLTMLRTAWLILTSREHFDAIYATHYKGLELVILLRALHLYRRPIIVWHHQPVVTARQWWREWLGKLFYRGFDRLIFFSQKLIDDSLRTHKVQAHRMVLGHWGGDLDFYDKVISERQGELTGSISTGKELRDMPTLVAAFNRVGVPLDIYVGRNTGGVDYEKVFAGLHLEPNVHVNFVEGLCPYDLARRVASASCIVICCKETKYTVGLTTLVEALALGIPIVCSRNPQFPIDIDAQGCGISVPYYDSEGWEKAIRYIYSHYEEAAEMGRRGRKLAEEKYNDRLCAEQISQVIRDVLTK